MCGFNLHSVVSSCVVHTLRMMNMLWLNASQTHLKIIVTYKLIMWLTSRCVCRTHGYVLMCVGAAILGVDGVKVHNENSNVDIYHHNTLY